MAPVSVAAPVEESTPSSPQRGRFIPIALGVLLAAMLVAPLGAALFELESGSAVYAYETRKAHWDAYTQRAVVERVHELGGTYYTTGTDQKGPLWLGVYSLADRISSHDGFWFAVAGLFIALAVMTGAAATATAYLATRSPPGAIAGGIAIVLYLTLGPEDYSQALLSRNITSALTSVAVALLMLQLFRRERWGSNLWVAAASGALIGLAVQTMPTTALVAVVLLGWLVVHDWFDRDSVAFVSLRTVVWSLAALVTALSAHTYYAARGLFGEFWTYWFTYNRMYTDAVGRSPLQIVGHGARELMQYYLVHRVQFALVVLFVVAGLVLWRLLSRAERLAWFVIVAWFAAELASVAVNQRFFGHYFVLTFVPIGFMVTLLLARITVEVKSPIRWVAPVVVIVLIVGVGWGRFSNGLAEAAAFDGIEARADDHVRAAEGWLQMQRAAVAMLVGEDEPILVWSRHSRFYTTLERFASTRYIENRWLTGHVGGTDVQSLEWVLPGTFDRFAEDLAGSPPVAVVEFEGDPIPGSIRGMIDAATPGLTEVATVDGSVVQVAAERIEALEKAFVDAGQAAWTDGVAGIATSASCFAVSGAVEGPAMIAIGGARDPLVYSGVRLDGTTAVTFHHTAAGTEPLATVGVDGGGWTTFTAYVRDRLLVVMVDGRVVGAVEAPLGTDGFGILGSDGPPMTRDLRLAVPDPDAWTPCDE